MSCAPIEETKKSLPTPREEKTKSNKYLPYEAATEKVEIGGAGMTEQ